MTKKKKPSTLKKVTVHEHPLLGHKLGVLRDRNTKSFGFRGVLEEISTMLAYELTRDLKTKQERIHTPLEATQAATIAETVVLISIQRAGSGMLGGFLRMMPFARVGHIGIYRDKFIQSTVEYYLRLPKKPEGERVFLLDPLLATGDTAVAAIRRLKESNVGEISFVCVLAAPQGIAKVQKEHPDVHIHCVSVERKLNEKGYIMPGLGDAGDRLYDTV